MVKLGCEHLDGNRCEIWICYIQLVADRLKYISRCMCARICSYICIHISISISIYIRTSVHINLYHVHKSSLMDHRFVCDSPGISRDSLLLRAKDEDIMEVGESKTGCFGVQSVSHISSVFVHIYKD